MTQSRVRDASRDPAPYPGKQPYGILPELVHGGVLSTWLQDDNLWVPQAENVDFKPVMLNVSNGYFVNILRVRKSGVLSVHRHSGAVHAFVLKGRWYYLEHEWTAEEGGYAYEPPGEIHTLYVPEDVPEMITLFHATGNYTYIDHQGNAVGYEDVFTKIENCRRHYKEIGLGEDYVKRFIR